MRACVVTRGRLVRCFCDENDVIGDNLDKWDKFINNANQLVLFIGFPEQAITINPKPFNGVDAICIDSVYVHSTANSA